MATCTNVEFAMRTPRDGQQYSLGGVGSLGALGSLAGYCRFVAKNARRDKTLHDK
jgi:hypothetical protein